MAFKVRHPLSRGPRARLAAGLGSFSTQTDGFFLWYGLVRVRARFCSDGCFGCEVVAQSPLAEAEARGAAQAASPTSAWC